jgi:hypothetical protein
LIKPRTKPLKTITLFFIIQALRRTTNQPPPTERTMKREYKGFVLEADIRELANGRYALGVIVIEYQHNADRVWSFSAANNFATKEEAEVRSLYFGKHILDGKVANCRVA